MRAFICYRGPQSDVRYLRATLRFAPELRHPMHAHLDEPGAERASLLTWNLSGDVTYALFYVLAPRDSYLRALDAVETMRGYDVAPVGEDAFYVFVREAPTASLSSLQESLASRELVVLPPFDYLPEGRLRMDALGDPDALRETVAALPEGISASVETLRSRPPAPGAREPLTGRQREALRVAEAVGYYDVPRTGSVADVAERMGVSESTAGTHLRKAESALVSGYVR